jgi:Leucine Rich repeats (2 copies)
MANLTGRVVRWSAFTLTCGAWFAACSGAEQHKKVNDGDSGAAGEQASGGTGAATGSPNGGQAAAAAADPGAAGLGDTGGAPNNGLVGEGDGGALGEGVGEGGAAPAPELCDAVVFTDTHLESIMRGATGVQTGPIPPAKAAAITFAFTSSLLVSNLEGMECFTGLTRFEAASNRITDVSPLAGLKRLTYLTLSGNKLTDISPLAGLTKLQTLTLGSNQLSDISALAELKQLTELTVGSNPLLTNIDVIADKTSLQVLQLDQDAAITSLQPLANLKALTKLTMRGVTLGDTALLADKVKLTYLDASLTGITTTSFLTNLTAMQTLVLSNNQISDISVLATLDKLNHVDLDSTLVTDISPLAANPGIQKGDTVFVQQMSFADCTAHLAAAQALVDRGVTLLAQCP